MMRMNGGECVYVMNSGIDFNIVQKLSFTHMQYTTNKIQSYLWQCNVPSSVSPFLSPLTPGQKLVTL